jgi:shikimate dehydrogenase
LAVIGSPVAHSLSPQLHVYGARLAGKDAFSFKCELGEQLLPQFIRLVRGNQLFLGFNVTMPHKRAVMSHLDQVDQVAKTLGAVNTVAKEGHVLRGYNTDWLALRQAVLQRRRRFGSALVVGAGGAAYAAVYGLLYPEPLVDHVYVDNRSQWRLTQLIEAFPQVRTARPRGAYDIIVNATPQTVEDVLSTNTATRMFVDLPYSGYNGERPPVLLSTQVDYVDGLEILARQGAAALKLFFKVDLNYEPIYQYVKRIHLARRRGAGVPL